jgi:cobalt-zinc-cadmium resistance protein CzcA
MQQKSNPTLSTAHTDYFASQVNEKAAAVKLEKSKFFPEFSVGYVRQKIAPLTGLNSWMVGIAIPIFYGAQSSRTKQAKIDAYIATTEADDNLRTLRNKVTELQSKLKQESDNINYYQTAALPEAESLLKNAQVQFRESETDITQFVQSINSAFDIRRGYIDAVYNYNVSVIELELYTE